MLVVSVSEVVMNEKLEYLRISQRLRDDIKVCKQLGKKLKIVREIKKQIDKARYLNSK